MSKMSAASAQNAGNVHPVVVKRISDVLDDEPVRRPRHFLRQVQQASPLQTQVRSGSLKNLGIIVEQLATAKTPQEENQILTSYSPREYSVKESQGTLEHVTSQPASNESKFNLNSPGVGGNQQLLQLKPNIDQRSHTNSSIRQKGSQIQVRIGSSDQQHSQDGTEIATVAANGGIVDTNNSMDERKENDATPSTVYNDNGYCKFKPRLGPINAGAEVIATATKEISPPQRGFHHESQTKNYQSMMVSMLKQQVKKRRKLHQKTPPVHQIQYNMANLIEDVRHSQQGSFAVTTGVQRSGQTTPIEGSVYKTEAQQTQSSQPDQSEDETYQQQIVFNMLRPKLPHHQQLLITNSTAEQGPLPLINLNQPMAARAPRTTKNNQSLDFAKMRLALNPLSSRNNWRQITDNSTRHSYDMVPETESPSARQNQSRSPTRRKLHDLLCQPATIREQQPFAANSAVGINYSNTQQQCRKSQQVRTQANKVVGRKKKLARGHQSQSIHRQNQVNADNFMYMQQQPNAPQEHAELPSIKSITDLKSQDSMNVGSYTLVPTYSKGLPVEFTITNDSSSANSADSLRLHVPSVNSIQPLAVTSGTADMHIEPDKHVSRKNGTGENRKFIDVPPQQPQRTPTDDNMTPSNFFLRSNEQTLSNLSQSMMREQVSRQTTHQANRTTSNATRQRPSDTVNDSALPKKQTPLLNEELEQTPHFRIQKAQEDEQRVNNSVADQSKSMGRITGVRATGSGLLSEPQNDHTNRAVIALQQIGSKNKTGEHMLPSPIIDEMPSLFDQASYDKLSGTVKDSHERIAGAMLRDDQSNMVAFEPPEPALFDQELRPEDFSILSPFDKQAAMAGKFGHFVLQKRIRELALSRTDSQLRQQLLQLPQQVQHELCGLQSTSSQSNQSRIPLRSILTSIEPYLKEKGTTMMENNQRLDTMMMEENMKDSQQQVTFDDDSPTSNTPTFILSAQNKTFHVISERARASTKKKKKKQPMAKNQQTQPIIVTGSSLLNNSQRTDETNQNCIDDSMANSRVFSPLSTSLTFDKAFRLNQTHYTNQSWSGATAMMMATSNGKGPKTTAVSVSRNDVKSTTVSSPPNIDKIEESKIFALSRDLEQVDVFRRPDLRNQKKVQRFTFSNIDRFFPQYYRVPPKPSNFDKFDHRSQERVRKQQQRKQPQNFQQKSPILQLLEVNGKLPKRNLTNDQSRSASVSVPCRNTMPEASALYGFNPVRPQRNQQQYEVKKDHNQDLFDQTQFQGNLVLLPDPQHQQQKARIYLQKVNSRSTLKKLLNMQEKLQRWSSEHDVHSEHMYGSQKQSEDDLNDFLRSTQRKSSLNYYSSNQAAQRNLAIERPSINRVAPMTPVSPKSSTRDAKNATARHSLFSEEDYETQYLSQVSRHGFFGAKSSIRNVESNNCGDEQFEREVIDDNSTSNHNLVTTEEKQHIKFQPRNHHPHQKKVGVKKNENMHKRLQDIAYRIKHDKKDAAAAGLIEDYQIKQTQRAESQNTVLRSANDSVTKIIPLSQQNIGHNKKLQLQLMRQGNNNNSNPSDGLFKKPSPSSYTKYPRTPNKSKEFRCIQIQHWDAVDIPETAKVLTVDSVAPPIQLQPIATTTTVFKQ